MRLRSFQYHTANRLGDALEKLDEYAPEIKALAGGTDLVLAMKQKRTTPKHVLNLLEIRDLDGVLKADSAIHIGALTTHSRLASHSMIIEPFPMLAEAAGLIGSWQIRNVATVGGNLCNASPAADLAPPLLALEAKAILVDSNGGREIPLQSFFTGPGSTVMKPNQLLKEVVVPVRACRSCGTYLKLMRKRAVDLSLLGVAFFAELDDSGERLQRVSVAMGGVAPTPIRASDAEAELTGLSCEKALERISTAAKAAVAATSPIDDVRASADYRRAVVEVFVQRAANKVLSCLLGG